MKRTRKTQNTFAIINNCPNLKSPIGTNEAALFFGVCRRTIRNTVNNPKYNIDHFTTPVGGYIRITSKGFVQLYKLFRPEYDNDQLVVKV